MLAGVALACLLTFRHYGVTWDEPLHHHYGRLVLEYYRSLGADQSAFHYQNLYLYGAAFDLVAETFNTFSPLGAYPTRHLFNAAVGLLGLAGAWRLGRELGGPRAGVLALLLLACTPVWYGQMFNNPKDVPFAAAMTWATYYLVLLSRPGPVPPWSLFARFGVAAGLALGVRVGGLLLFGYLGLVMLLWLLPRAGLPEAPRGVRLAGRLALRSLLALAVAWGVMLLGWPWAQQQPVFNPIAALRQFSHFPLDFTFPFAGEIVRSTDLPWYYIPWSMVVKLPEPVVLAVLAVPVLVWRALRQGDVAWRPWAALGMALLLPPLYIVFSGAVLYDGIRQVLFLVPLLAVVAAVVLDTLWERMPAATARRLTLAVGGVWLAQHLAAMVVLHPNEYIHFNRFAGGVAGAAGHYELEYWGNSMKEAAEGLVAALVAEEGTRVLAQPLKVSICGPASSATEYLPRAWEIWDNGPETRADLFVNLERMHCPLLPGAQILVQVQRAGVTLSTAGRVRAAMP